MNLATREHLEKKLSTARFRKKRIIPNPNYDDLELGQECSKAFGFPDNSMLHDPDSSILGVQHLGSLTGSALDEMSSRDARSHARKTT